MTSHRSSRGAATRSSAMRTGFYLFTSLALLSADGATADGACAVDDIWFSVTYDKNRSSLDCFTASANNVTELVLNATNSSSPSETEDTYNATCRQQMSVESFRLVSSVTVIGQPSSNGSSLSLAACFPQLNRVAVVEADVGWLTRAVLDALGSTQLEELDLRNDGITTVEPETFDTRLGRLQVLDLSGNSLTTVDNGSFIDLFSLRLINLSFNAIYRIERAAFATSPLGPIAANGSEIHNPQHTSNMKERLEMDAWPALDTVDLRHNVLSELDEMVFRGALSNVRQLLLSYNRISSLPRYIVDQLHQLTAIDLSHNDLVWLDVGAFSSASLHYVDLSHNALRKLVSMTFLYLPSIVEIDLSHNKINQIYKYAFYRLCKADDTDSASRDLSHPVNISLRANELETDVIFQVMTLFEQQQDLEGSSGCSVNVDLTDNRIRYFLDPNAALHLDRQDLSRRVTHRYRGDSTLFIDLKGNDIQCDCRLASNLATFDKVASASHQTPVTSAANSAALAWRNLNCSGPELFTGFTVAEFAAYSLCPPAIGVHLRDGEYVERASDGDVEGYHVGIMSTGNLSDGAFGRDKSLSIATPAGSTDINSVAGDQRHHSAAAFSGSHAALVALLLCAAALALLGGLLFRRGGGELSALRRVSLGSRRRRGDVFIVYGVEDEAWVTGTLLDVIYQRYPRYGVVLQHHVDPACASWYSHRKRRGGDEDRWPHARLVLNSCMDSCLMTIIVVSNNFFSTVWKIDKLRSLLLAKLRAQTHRFLLVSLTNDVTADDVHAERKQFFESSSVYPRLEAVDRHFVDRLIDCLPSSARHRANSIDTEESVALISEDGGCRHERY